MRRALVGILASVWLMVGCLLPSRLHARTIAVVYDDSGSMKQSSRWAYANYSMQTLRAIMSDEDRLLVIFMNEPSGAVWRSQGIAEKDIAELAQRSRFRPADTPYISVSRAIDALAQNQDNDRWLIIATDGNFDPAPSDSEIEGSIEDFLTKVPGGRVILLGIGEGTRNPVFNAWRQRVGADTFGANDEKEIIPVLGEIAARVASNADIRRRLQPDLSGNRLRFMPEFPLKRLTVLQQSTNRNALVAISSGQSGETRLSIPPGRATATPEGRKTFGLTTQIFGENKGMIPSGDTLTLSLAGNVSNPDQLVLVPEVDAKLQVEFFDKRGDRLAAANGTYQVCQDDLVQAKMRLEFPHASGPIKANWGDAEALVRTGGAAQRLSWEDSKAAFTGHFKVAAGSWPLSASLSFPGYFSFRKEGQLRAVECAPRQISLVARVPDAHRLGPDHWGAPVTGLPAALPVELVPLIDGREATPTEIQGWQLTAECSGLRTELRPPPAGSSRWLLRPVRDGWCAPCLADTGTFAVSFPRLVTDRPEDVVSYPALQLTVAQVPWFERCWVLAVKILLALVALLYLIGLVKKPRFATNGAVRYERKAGISSKVETYLLAGPWYSRYLVPFVAEKKYVEDVLFRAGKTIEHVLVPRRYLSDDMLHGGLRIDPQEREDLRLSNGETLQRKSRMEQVSYRYESESESNTF